jgi:hypothetical protein
MKFPNTLVVQKMADVDKDIYSYVQNQRMGLLLFTFYKEDSPIGSLLLDPIEDKLIIESLDGTLRQWNLQTKQQRDKEERIRRDVRTRNKDNSGSY